MPNLYASKQPHGLHRCAAPKAFLAGFERCLGRDLASFVVDMAPKGCRYAVLLTGSIPEGIASAVSDIDLMIVADTDDDAGLDVSVLGENVSMKTGAQGGAELAIVDSVVAGLEIDVALISGPRLGALLVDLERGGVTLRDEDIRVLSRIRRGWILLDQSDYLASFPALRQGNALEIYCSTTAYSLALKALEDAIAAAGTDDDLSFYLARRCVEYGIQAYLAGIRYCHPSAKWLSVLKRLPRAPALDAGVGLLFSDRPGDAAALRDYLARVQDALCDIRRLIERDPALRIAFGFCPQIYVPAFASAS